MDFPHCLGGSFGGMQWEGRCLLLGDIPLVATFGTAAGHVYVMSMFVSMASLDI